MVMHSFSGGDVETNSPPNPFRSLRLKEDMVDNNNIRQRSLINKQNSLVVYIVSHPLTLISVGRERKGTGRTLASAYYGRANLQCCFTLPNAGGTQWDPS
jgi:hypothetical protein